ncbi:MAG TPA: hypothetical protein VGI81_01330 [Tepidisphaeraceae bacterium]
MIRRLFAAAPLLLLVPCMATVVLWIRSYSHYDVIRWWNASLTHGIGATSSSTGLSFWVEIVPNGVSGPEPGVSREYLQEDRPPKSLDFEFTHGQYSGGAVEQWTLSFPHWTLALVFLVTPLIIRAVICLRNTRALPGLCRTCGYDLRASKDRCPECGTPIPAKVKA